MQNILNVTTKEANEVQLDINLANANYTVNGHAIESVTMYVDSDCMGDLAVTWKYDESDTEGYVESTMLLMRNTGSDDNVTQTMGQFYWDNCFTATLVQILLDAGFSTSAANDVCTSEWGMQDEGRASYDANLIGEEMLAAHNLVYEDA